MDIVLFMSEAVVPATSSVQYQAGTTPTFSSTANVTFSKESQLMNVRSVPAL